VERICREQRRERVAQRTAYSIISMSPSSNTAEVVEGKAVAAMVGSAVVESPLLPSLACQ